ncbi:MAG: hypothetical protein AAFV98_07280 [Chloroflexota bacterium]
MSESSAQMCSNIEPMLLSQPLELKTYFSVRECRMHLEKADGKSVAGFPKIRVFIHDTNEDGFAFCLHQYSRIGSAYATGYISSKNADSHTHCAAKIGLGYDVLLGAIMIIVGLVIAIYVAFTSLVAGVFILAITGAISLVIWASIKGAKQSLAQFIEQALQPTS